MEQDDDGVKGKATGSKVHAPDPGATIISVLTLLNFECLFLFFFYNFSWRMYTSLYNTNQGLSLTTKFS